MPALRRQRKEDLCEFKASLIYIVSLRPARDTSEILLKNNNNFFKALVLS